MEEQGVVMELRKNNTALIKSARTSACDSCGSKKSCSTGGSGTEMLMEADNVIGAQKGDHVVFAVAAGTIMKAGLILYLVPLVSFIVGVVAGQAVVAPLLPNINPDLVSGVLGVIFLVAAFIGIKIYNRAMEKKGGSMRPKILRKV